MGIPAYFRWISLKYPEMMVDCVEFVDFDASSGHETPIDATVANPNGVEFDNLYLDMNGIIHPCTHPEDRPAPTTEEEMFAAIFDYIDRIFSIVRPRKLVYMAIDGVAPRAKINQQRSRRFRSAKEAEEKLRVSEELRDEWDKMGLKVAEEDDDDSNLPFDSNVITPGTPFMSRLAVALRVYVAERIRDNPAWKNLVIVFSDASVPGEGEHKIAEYIRRERTQPGYNPNLRHVMYGLDADLIMLALATHEVYFTILREEVFAKNGQRSGGRQHPRQQNKQPPQIDSVAASMAQEAGLSTRAELGGKKPFHFLHVNILREYLDYEFKGDIEKEIASAKASTDISYDLERVLDDFVFMCFFVGNDFLPHLPTLDIREGAIDYLIELYKTELARTGYLTSSQGDVDFVRVRKLLQCVGRKEDEVFKERTQREQQSADRAAREKMEKSRGKKSENTTADVPRSPGAKRTSAEKDKGYQDAAFSMHTVELGRKDKKPRIGSGEANAAAAAALRAGLVGIEGKPNKPKRKSAKGDSISVDNLTIGDQPKGSSAKLSETLPVVMKSKPEFKEALNQRMREKNELEPFDNVKLGEEGWKERYYRQKFGWGPEDNEHKLTLLRKYVEGLQWVMKYYFVGCMSWGWYYPYHYAPFASDLVECDINSEDLQFELGTPFAPFTQLQAVMPASSGKLVLPTCYSDLMTNPESPIIDYYPENFDLDLNGKRFAWQGVALLPFIDEVRLNSALAPLQGLLTEEERERNSFGDCCVMVHRDTRLGMARSMKKSENGSERKKISTEAAQGQLFGKCSYPLSKFGGTDGSVFTMIFQLPAYKPHSSQLLPTARMPPACLNAMSRADSRRSGWKQAKFGPLGRAAKDLINDRNRRLGGAGGSRHRPRGGSGPRTGYLPDAPVINGPGAVGANPALSNMFGGLGTQQQPSWMRGTRGGMHRGGVQGQQAQAQRGQYAHRQQHMQQPQPPAYPVPMDPYREPSKFGGYYPQQQAQTGWGGTHPQAPAQAGWQPRAATQAGWGNPVNNSGGYDAGYGAGGYQPGDASGNGYYYNAPEHSTGRGRGGRRGGLAGPTAGSLRFRRGQGQGPGSSYSGGWPDGNGDGY